MPGTDTQEEGGIWDKFPDVDLSALFHKGPLHLCGESTALMASGPKGKPAIPITREMWVGRSLSSSRPGWSLKHAHTEPPPRPKGKGRPAACHKGRSFAVRRQLCYCLLLIKKINTLQKNLAKSNHPLVDIFTAQNRIPKGLIGNKLENITHPQGVSNPGDMPTEHTQEFYSSYHNDTDFVIKIK